MGNVKGGGPAGIWTHDLDNPNLLVSIVGPLLSLVTVFFNFIPLPMSPSNAPLPFCSFLLSLGLAVLADPEEGGGGGAAGGGGGGGGIVYPR